MDLVDMNLSVLDGKHPSDLDQSIRKSLNELSGGKCQMIFPIEKLNLADKEAAKLYMKQYTEDICKDLLKISFHLATKRCMKNWIWGRNYNFLHLMRDEAVPVALLKSNMRDYEDAGLLLNSPYFSVLREERQIDLIISLDYMWTTRVCLNAAAALKLHDAITPRRKDEVTPDDTRGLDSQKHHRMEILQKHVHLLTSCL
ncbi:Cytosolic phospholipase A2 gamma [Labeo rohita]|uniref:Cytosolic phospholipase A2 gamma n=1 Tax=Labeo rohita TaxID=84645 RepID=A0ABQ8L954_LABRO|nr:Cytosolic phospholipase A2 gamma [Labeo rohita]